MSLTPKTQSPWISHHRTILCYRDTMIHLMNTAKKVTLIPLADLLQQFQQLKNQFANLKFNTPQSTPTEELLHLTDELQHLTMVLQPAHQSSEESVHKTMQAYTYTLCTTQRQSNLATTMLHDIPTFDGQDSSKLEDWFMDIETTANILTKSHTHLDEAKSQTHP